MLFKSTATLLSLVAASSAQVATVYRYVGSTATIYADYCPCPASTGISNPSSGASGNSGSGAVAPISGSSGTGSNPVVVVGSGSGSTGSGNTGSGSTGSSGLIPVAGGAPGFQIYISLSIGVSVGVSTVTTVNNGNTVTAVVTTTATVTTPVTVTSPLSGGAGVNPLSTGTTGPSFTNSSSAASSTQSGGAGVAGLSTFTTTGANGTPTTVTSTLLSNTASRPTTTSSSSSSGASSTTSSSSAASTSSTTTPSSSTTPTSSVPTTTPTPTPASTTLTAATPSPSANIVAAFPANNTANSLSTFSSNIFSSSGAVDGDITNGGTQLDVNQGALTSNPAYLFGVDLTAATSDVSANSLVSNSVVAWVYNATAAASDPQGAPFVYQASGTVLPAGFQAAIFTVTPVANSADYNNPALGFASSQGTAGAENPPPGFNYELTIQGYTFISLASDQSLRIISYAAYQALTDGTLYNSADGNGGMTNAYLFVGVPPAGTPSTP